MQVQRKTLAAGLWMALACNAAAIAISPATGPGLTDQVSAADPRRATATGPVAISTVGDFVGGHDTRRPAWVISGGGSLEWKLRVVPNQPVTLEIEEIYGRDADVRGYSVLVDGKRHYFRTFRGCGAGPVHYFVQLPPQERSEISVKLVNDHDAPVAISRAWSFSNFADYFRAGEMAVPYAFAPTLWMTFDFEKDLAKLETIKQSMADSPHARAAWTTWIGYANLTEHETRRQIDHVIRLCNAASMPVQLSFDMWWGNSPSGSDGKGGYWSDVRYQQIVFNETTKQFHLSIPNRWSNTPWRTMNDPALNGYKVARLRAATAYLRERVNASAAEGKTNPILAVNLDNEPVYWASGNAGLGNDELWADFNPLVIADAKKDGLTLDPADGLSREERLWLHRNILNYNTLTADAAVAGVAKDAIVVKGDEATPSSDPLANNIYTQAFVADPTLQFPLLDPAHGLWETAAPANIRVGGEYNGDSQVELEAIAHHIALGRTAAVNAEMGNRDESIGAVAPGYAFGVRYWTPYNYPLDKMQTAVKELADQSLPFPPRLYERRLLESEFRGDAWKSQVVEQSGVEAKILGNTAAMALASVSSDVPAYITYRLTAPNGTFDGLGIELSGRAFVSKAKDERVNIRILAGDAADVATMREVKRIHDSGDINEVRRTELSDVARGKKSLFVRIELNAPGLSGEHLSWASVRRVAFTVPWPKEVTTSLPKQDETIATQRMQNLVVSWRRDAELAIEQLERQLAAGAVDESIWRGNPASSPVAQLELAKAAIGAGRYAEAYRIACACSAATLPARFDVREPGMLQPYPIRVEAASPVVCEVRQISADKTVLSLHADGREAVATKIVITGMPTNAKYEQRTEDGELQLTRAESGTLVASAEGELHVEVNAQPAATPTLPTNVVGMFKGTDALLKQVQVTQDNGDGIRGVRYDDSTDYELRDSAQATTVPIALKQLARGDQLTVTADDNGVARLVVAERRTLEGKVEAMKQLTTTEMASVRVSGDGADHVIDLNATLHLADGDTTVRAQPLGTLKLAVGDRVRVRLNPTNGRVVELWKLP